MFMSRNRLLRRMLLFLTPFFVFAGFVASISYRVFPNHGLLMYGDAPYFWPSSNFNVFSTWFDSFLGESWLLRMCGTPITGNFPLFLTSLGLSHELTSYTLNFLPVFLVCILFFYTAKIVSGNIYYGYFVGLFIILNNFILEQFIVWPGHYFWNVLGLGLLFYLTWVIYEHGLSVKRSVLVILSSLLIIHPFLWVLYVSYSFCFILFVAIAKKDYKFFACGLLILGCLFLIHGYWLVPFLHSLTIQGAEGAYSGNLAAVLEGYRSVATSANLFNLLNYPGFLDKGNIHNTFQIFFNFTLLILLALALLAKRMAKFTLFLIVVLLFYFNLALGPNSLLSGKLWLWAFNHVPGFGFFRSFTRFLQISLISIIFIFALIVKNLEIKYKNIFIGGMIVFLIFSHFIFFTGDLDGTIGTANVSKEYFDINAKYFNDKDVSTYSILCYPNIAYESNVWSINRNVEVFPQITYFKQFFLSQPIVFNAYFVSLDRRNDLFLFKDIFGFNDKFRFTDNFDSQINQMNVRYILIQKDLFDILNIDKAVEYQKYVFYFNNNDNYNLKEDNQYFSLYKNKNYRPLIFGENINF